MTLPHTQTDKLARSLLPRRGIGAIWALHEAAAAAHRTGFPQSAAALIEVAETAEREWMSLTELGATDLSAQRLRTRDPLLR